MGISQICLWCTNYEEKNRIPNEILTHQGTCACRVLRKANRPDVGVGGPVHGLVQFDESVVTVGCARVVVRVNKDPEMSQGGK